MRCKQMFFALVAMLSCFVLSANAQNVAKIGGTDTEYASLSDAIEAATAGQTITFIGDVNENVTVNKSVTIDGADFNYTGTLTAKTGLTVTVQNVNFFNAGIVKESGTKGTITVKDCNFDGADRTYDYAVKTSGAGKLTIENCTVKDYSYGFLYNSKSLTTHSVKNVTVENCNYGVRMGSTTTTNLVNFVTKDVKWPVQIQANAARTVNMTDCSITEVKEVEDGGAPLSCWGGTSNVTFNFYGTNKFDAALPEDANFVYKENEKDEVDNVVIVKPAVAKIGEQGYETLSAAVAAAKAGNTITLVRDVAENVTLSKNVTIDGAGKNYTGTITAQTSVTVQNLNFVNAGFTRTKDTKGTYNIKNCTFDGKDTYAYSIYLPGSNGVLNVENCTVKNYLYSFLYVPKAGTTISVKNVVAENLPSYAVMFNSGFTASFENFTVKNSPVGFNVNNTAVRKLTFKNCKMEEVSTAVNHRSGTSSISCTFQGVNDFGGAAFSQYVTLNADAMVGTAIYPSLSEAVEAAKTGDTVTLLRNVQLDALLTIDKSITLDLGEYNITRDARTALYVEGDDVEVTINGKGTVSGKQALYVGGGLVKVYGGNFHGLTEAVYVQHSGKAEIYGGKFSSDNVTYVLNEYDSTRETSDITVYGGTFVGFNPADNAAEGAGTNFVADSYVSQNNGDGTYSVVFDPAYGKAAKIGDTYYETFAEAYAAAQAGETVTLLADLTMNEKIVIEKSIAIDGNGKTLTYTGSGASARAIDVPTTSDVELDVTIKNLTVDCTASYCQRGINYNDNGKLTLDNVTVKGTNVTYALNLPGSSVGANVTINNSKLTANIALNVWGKDAVINAKDSHFTSVDNSTVEGYSAIALNNDGTTAAEGAEINIIGGSITALDQDDKPSNALRNSTATGTINVSETTVVTGNYTRPVAIVTYANTDQFYSCATLQAAIDKAIATNGTVKLIADVKGAGAVINGSVAIDFNGKTYTANAGVGSKGTETLGLQILKGDVVLKNGTLTSEGENIKMLINNYTNLTVEKMNLVDATDVIQYVLSNNCGEVAINNSVITSDAVALDACKYANYEAPVVTVADGSTINGNVEVSATLNMNGTLNGTVVINGATGVVNGANELTVTTTVEKHKVVCTEADGKYIYSVKKINHVAQIGETQYEDLAEAFAAAQSDDTVTLISDIELDEDDYVLNDAGYKIMFCVKDKKSITLNMNSKTITVAYRKDVENGTENAFDTKNDLFAVFCIEDGASLTVTGNGKVDLPQENRKVAYIFWKRGTTGALVIENGTFHAGNLEDSMVYTNGSDIVTVEGGTFTLDGVKSHGNGFPVIFNASGNNVRHINVTGGTYNTDITDQVWPNEVKLGEGCAIKDNRDDTWTVIKVGAYVAESADGKNEPYSSLAEAVAAAQDGNIVTLAADAVGEGIVINKSITINFNGKTYTFDGGVGSTGTETLGLQIMKDNNVTLKNGTLTSTGEKVKMLIQNYANLDVVNMNLNDETDYIQHVLSSNYGKTQILGNTNITTDAVAFDSYDYTKYYPAPAVVIVKTEGTIEGAIEKSEKATIEIYSGTYTMDVDEWCADGYATVDNHDGTWTVESLNVDYMELNTDTYANFEVQNEKKVAELRLIRNMSYDAASGVSMVDKWTGIYLPFALPVSALGDDYEVAYFNDIHCYDKDEDGKIDDMAVEYVKIKSGTLYPNTPYAIKPKTEDAVTMDIVLGNVTLVPTGENNNVIECSSAFVAFQFGGVYNFMTATDLLENVNTTYLSIEKTPIAYLYWNGKLNTDLANPDRMWYYPFQVYMTLCAKDGSPYELDTEKLSTIGSRVVGEENDGVTTIYDVPEEMDVEGLIFDLSGRRVNETEKGIYIKDGKKVLVK